MAGYTGPIYRGVDYSPTWPSWVVGAGGTQTGDSDFANDAFASLWDSAYQAAAGGTSVPVDNGTNYRDDLKTIANDGFNLVRLYNWDMARGTTATSNTGYDHINFLNYAESLGLKVVVPVSDYFLNDTPFSWDGTTPDSSYSFSSAPAAIQTDFTQFIASITDPTTGQIHSAVHSISVGNEGDIGEGLQGPPPTDASDFLARTNWWIYNLHQQINGSGTTGPDGSAVVNTTGPIVPLTATFANADQGTGISSWFKALVSGVTAGQDLPNTWFDGSTTFSAAVTGLATADSTFESYYYNSFNIGQSTTTAPFTNSIAATLALYDSGASPWPGEQFNVPLMLMEVFTPNRDQYPTASDQVQAAIYEAQDIEAYIAAQNGGTSTSSTWLMGYNYFEFNDEPALNKSVGLYQYGTTSQNAQTGTTSVFYSPYSFPDMSFPVYTLTATPGLNDQGTLVAAWTGAFPHGVASIAALAASRTEGNGGWTPFTFTVTRGANTSEAATVGFSVTGSGTNPADAADFAGGVLPSGVIPFAPGETSKILTIFVAGDTLVEQDERFVVTLSDPSEGLTLGAASAGGTIFNDDARAYDDAYVILQGRSLTAAATNGVLANDETLPPEAAALQSGVAHGQLQLGLDGGLAYTASAGFSGIDSFSYYAFGDHGASSTALATIHVVPLLVGATATTLNLLALTAEEQIASTYAAFFGRAADAAGFDFWLGEFDRGLPTQGPAALFANIAGSFAASAEAKALYPFLANPVGASDAQIGAFIDSVYDNLFDRSSDAGGLAYWTGQTKQMLQSGQSVGSVLVDIMSGAQDTAAASDITTLMSKVAVGLAYVRQQELHDTVWAGASDIAAATTLLDGVTADPHSVLVGVRSAAELIANHA